MVLVDGREFGGAAKKSFRHSDLAANYVLGTAPRARRQLFENAKIKKVKTVNQKTAAVYMPPEKSENGRRWTPQILYFDLILKNQVFSALFASRAFRHAKARPLATNNPKSRPSTKET